MKPKISRGREGDFFARSHDPLLLYCGALEPAQQDGQASLDRDALPPTRGAPSHGPPPRPHTQDAAERGKSRPDRRQAQSRR